MPRPAGASTADDIRKVALSLFVVHGYHATSMRDIADRVGIRAASLYNHFQSKEQILWDLTQSAQSALAEARDAVLDALPADARPVDRLDAVVRAHVRFHALNGEQAQLVNTQLSALSKPHHRHAVEERDAYQASFVDILEAGVASGEFSPVDVALATYGVLQMLTGVATWYRRGGRLSVDEVCDVYAEFAARVVGA